MTAIYRPQTICFENAEMRFAEGRHHISTHSNLQIDASGLDTGNTAAVCALIEWQREAQKQNCHLTFHNIPPRLQDLIRLYQLSDIFELGAQ